MSQYWKRLFKSLQIVTPTQYRLNPISDSIFQNVSLSKHLSLRFACQRRNESSLPSRQHLSQVDSSRLSTLKETILTASLGDRLPTALRLTVVNTSTITKHTVFSGRHCFPSTQPHSGHYTHN